MTDLRPYEYLANKKRNKTLSRVFWSCFLVLLLIHILDSITTYIGLSLGARETNPITGYLFTFGLGGYLLAEVYVIVILLGLFLFLECIIKFYRLITYKEMPVSVLVTMYIVYTSTVFLGILMAVLNNISVIFSLLG